jgi:hypothetical protein
VRTIGLCEQFGQTRVALNIVHGIYLLNDGLEAAYASP